MVKSLASGTASPPTSGALPVGLKLGWATGAMGVAILMNGIAGVILVFASSILKIDPWLAGTIIFVSKLVDVVTDPVVGMWSDRHRGPKGRRRPFMLWGSILAAISFAVIFATPVFENQYLTAAYLFLALCLYAFAYTLFNIPYLSMPAEMTDDYHERSSIHGYRMIFISIGSLVATSGVKFSLDSLGMNEWQSYAIVGFACGVIILVSTMIAFLTTSSARFTAPEPVNDKGNFDQFVVEMKAVSDNRHFLRLIGVKFAQLMGIMASGAGFAYFFVQYLGSDFKVLAWFGLAVSASTLVFSPILVRLSRSIGKKNVYYIAAGVNVLYALSWSFAGPGDPDWMIIARALLVGIAFTGNVVMAMSMLTDIINQDAERTGIRREGAFTSLYSFVEKLTGALGPLIVGVALSYAGFDKNLPLGAPQGENVDTVLLMSVSWLPALFGVVAVWLLSGYTLTEDDINSTDPDNEKHS